MPFADIQGHDRIIEVLHRSLRSGKTAHSYLFEGVPGCGRKKTAQTLIQALFCQVLPDDACIAFHRRRFEAVGAFDLVEHGHVVVLHYLRLLHRVLFNVMVNLRFLNSLSPWHHCLHHLRTLLSHLVIYITQG